MKEKLHMASQKRRGQLFQSDLSRPLYFLYQPTLTPLLTVRRNRIGTFASVCSKIAIFKRLENYPKDMQNLLSFHQLIDHIGETSE